MPKAAVSQAELVEVAQAVLKSCMKRVEKGHWVPADISYHAEQHCVHCAYKECAEGCFVFGGKGKHNADCIVTRAQEIVRRALPRK